MLMKTVYCDESGNTGSNFLDPQQPIYVLAGWWVDPNVEKNANDAVIRYLGSVPGSPRELHGAQLLRQSKGQSSTLQLFRELGALGCVPIFVLAEKRYCIAGKIIETFLDPYYNHLLCEEFAADVDMKQDIADTICELPEDIPSKICRSI